MKKLEFAISMALRVIVFIWALTTLIREGYYLDPQEVIGYYTIVLLLLYSCGAQIRLLYVWDPRKSDFYQF